MVCALDHVQVAAPPGAEAAARRFFGELLGLRELAKPPRLAARGGVWFALDGTRQLHIGVVGDGFVAATKAHVGLRVPAGELEPLAERLAAAGHPISWADPEEIPGRVRFHTTDPWGNRLELLGPEPT